MNRLSGIVAGCRDLAAALRCSDSESANFMDARAARFAAILSACRYCIRK